MNEVERTKRPILLSWSSGKDSAWALHLLRQDPRVEVRGLITTVNEEHERVAMHGVRRSLLRMQAEAVALPLHEVVIPSPCSNDDYEERFLATMHEAGRSGIDAIGYGDLYLEDVRRYRERLGERGGLDSVFPLWGLDTEELAHEMIETGAKAVLTCIDPKACPRALVGRAFDRELLRDLPEGVDPCGENGEFHTFCHAGPAFREAIPIETGEVVERGGFVFVDLTPRQVEG